jgi:hypothetical protein
MYPYTDAQIQLDLHNQRAHELRAEAAAHRLARGAAPSAGRHRRFRWGARRARGVRAPALS